MPLLVSPVFAKGSHGGHFSWAWESHQYAVSEAYGQLKPKDVKHEAPVTVTQCTDDNNVGERMLELDEVVNQ